MQKQVQHTFMLINGHFYQYELIYFVDEIYQVKNFHRATNSQE